MAELSEATIKALEEAEKIRQLLASDAPVAPKPCGCGNS
jgi:hypothetical protein